MPNLFVIIQLLPHLLYPLPLLLRRLAVLSCALKSQAAQAHVHFVFGVGAISSYFPEETFRVAFVEGGDDLCAACVKLVVQAEMVGTRAAHSFGLPRCGDADACWACAIVV